MRFGDLAWSDSGVSIDGLDFRFQHGRAADLSAADHFTFYKLKSIVDDYERFFADVGAPRGTMLEIGMWDGGSIAFWQEVLRPARSIGIDLMDRSDSAYFQQYLERRPNTRIQTHWNVNQSDRARIHCILQDVEDLDLVFDDASHLYEPSRASFETVFPMLRPGGWYVIEDWAWSHWPDYQGRRAKWADERALSDLARELVSVVGSSGGMIRRLVVFPGFVAAERGEAAVSGRFDLASATRSRGSDRVRQVRARLRAARSVAGRIGRRITPPRVS